MWPKRLEALAAEYEVEVADMLGELVRRNVPVREFAGQRVVLPTEFVAALQRTGDQDEPSSQVGHLDRIMQWLADEGCATETLRLGDKRARHVYSVSSRLGEGETVGLKVQICNTVQRGKWVHFNLDTTILRDGRIQWIILVSPSFAPGTTDFAVRRDDLLRLVKASPYADKASYPFRVKADSAEHYLDRHKERMLIEIHGSHRRWQVAKQAVAE